MSAQLQLMDLPTPEQPAKPKSWQQSFAGVFWYKYKEATQENCKLGFGALKKMLNDHAVKYWVDDETGMPEIPSIEQWTEEVEAFFRDSFAANERGFHFSYLLKQYGSFKKFSPVKRTAPSDLFLSHRCRNCNHMMKQKRSFWLRHKDQRGTCSHCQTPFSVNDVLNQNVGIDQLLPGQRA